MKEYLTKLKEINTDKAKNVIKLIEAFDDKTSDGAKREALEDAKELIEAHRTVNDTREILRNALKSRFNDEFGPYIVDHSEVEPLFVIYERDGHATEQSDYSIDDSHKVTLENPINVTSRTVWDPVKEAKKNKNGQFDLFEKNKAETITGDYIKLIESSVSDDGTIPIKIIGPGWGTSGYYSEKVLARDAGIYKEGTKMYWNHPTASEEIERPERSLSDLAAVTVGESYWDAEGSAGPGVYSKSKPFSDYAQSIEEMGKDIGLSHIAMGTATTGEAEGKTGRIIESLDIAESVDFVTTAGAGGEIIQLFESARKSKALPKKIIKMEENKELIELKESNQVLTDEIKRFKEKEVLTDARNFVEDKLKESDFPAITKARLLDSLSRNPAIDDKGALDLLKFGESVKKGIEDETSYLAKLYDSGKITGMGSSTEVEKEQETKVKESVKKSFEKLGLEGKALEIAVNGR